MDNIEARPRWRWPRWEPRTGGGGPGERRAAGQGREELRATQRRRRSSGLGSTSRSTCPPRAGTRSRPRAGRSRAAPRWSPATSRGRSAARVTRRRCSCRRARARRRTSMCVGHRAIPTMRFFAKRTSGTLLNTLLVEVEFEGSRRALKRLPIGVVLNGGSWQPTLPFPVLANLLPLLPGAAHAGRASRSRRSVGRLADRRRATSIPGRGADRSGGGDLLRDAVDPAAAERQRLAGHRRPPRGPGTATRAARAPPRRSPRRASARSAPPLQM